MMMRLATFNTNFFKTGRDLCDTLIEQGVDVICLQRVREEDALAWHIPDRYASCFHGDVPRDESSRSGVMTIAARDLEPKFTSVTLAHGMQRHNAWQGNHAIVSEMAGIKIINCLPCYPELQITQDDWQQHVQTCINLGSWSRSIIVGDFHSDDHDREWHSIDLHGFVNHASHLNTFFSGNGYRSSLDKAFARSDVNIIYVHPAILPHRDHRWYTRGMHWPVLVELA